MLHLSKSQFAQIVEQGVNGKPLEVCGLLAGQRTGDITEVVVVFPADNDDRSEKTYSVNARDFMRAERGAREAGLALVGIYHTHPATLPYPSATDVARAHWGETDYLTFPGFSYLIVSLRDEKPEPRSFKISGRRIPEDVLEEAVEIS